MTISMNYADLTTLVNNYRNSASAAQPQHAPMSVQDLDEIRNEVKQQGADGIRIYLALGDSKTKDIVGNDIMHNGFDGLTILLAVPTVNKVDDNVVNNTITCFPIGVTPVRDNIGMCPPACPAPGAQVI